MRKRCFPDSGNVFQQQVSPGKKTHHSHLNDMILALDNAGNIVLNRLDRSRCAHIGIIGSGGSEMGGDRTPLESSKGSEDGQFIRGFPSCIPLPIASNWKRMLFATAQGPV